VGLKVSKMIAATPKANSHRTIGRVSRGQVKELGRLDFAQTVDTGDHIADKSGKGDLTRTRDARPREKVN
tara:strand:+ start:522 stop:731 length:210 start_codon:yes stop_codon:yes gene_type:complete